MKLINYNPVRSKNISPFLLFIFTINFLLILNVIPQVTEEWVARYNGPGGGADESRAITVDSSGNVYVTGYSYGLGTDFDYATIKYNSLGVQQWVARYDGPGNGWDCATSIAIDNLLNVYVTGYCYVSGTSPYENYDYATIKYNSLGIQQWVERYNGPGNGSDRATAIAIDSLGNVYVTGDSSGLYTSYDYATIKYNTAGVQQWLVRYNGGLYYDDWAKDIAIDNSGNVYVTGFIYDPGISSTENSDYATIKYNSAGVQQWVARYNGPGNYYDSALVITTDISENVYVTGCSVGLGTDFDYATIKYNSSGVQQWLARYNGPGNNSDVAYAIAVDTSGNIYVTGESYASETSYDYATIKYNSSGVQQWLARYNGLGSMSDYAYAMAIDSSGNVYVTGRSDGSGPFPTENSDYATIKYNSAGVQQWVAKYDGPVNRWDWAKAIAIDSSGNVYVTGYSRSSVTSGDYATIKYSQGTSIKECIWSLY